MYYHYYIIICYYLSVQSSKETPDHQMEHGTIFTEHGSNMYEAYYYYYFFALRNFKISRIPVLRSSPPYFALLEYSSSSGEKVLEALAVDGDHEESIVSGSSSSGCWVYEGLRA